VPNSNRDSELGIDKAKNLQLWAAQHFSNLYNLQPNYRKIDIAQPVVQVAQFRGIPSAQFFLVRSLWYSPLPNIIKQIVVLFQLSMIP